MIIILDNLLIETLIIFLLIIIKLGYARLGQIYKEYNELELSIENYEKSLVLDAKNEEYNNFLADLRSIKSARARNDHFDPDYFPRTTEENNEKIEAWFEQRIGPNRNESNKDHVNFVIELLTTNDPTLKDVFKAHEFRDGSENTKQNYEMAAKYYSKAMLKGNAEAYYNMALLSQNGLGTLN